MQKGNRANGTRVNRDPTVMGIIRIQDGCRNVSGGSGAYQKWKAKAMGGMWKKFGAFVRNVHIHLKSCAKLPDYIE